MDLLSWDLKWGCICLVLQYNFEGRYDLARFIKTVQKVGLYVHLRIGPYICGEWNFGYSSSPVSSHACSLLDLLRQDDHILSFSWFVFNALIYFSFSLCRGFPVWLKYVPGISFRTDNEPFKVPFLFSLHFHTFLIFLCW